MGPADVATPLLDRSHSDQDSSRPRTQVHPCVRSTSTLRSNSQPYPLSEPASRCSPGLPPVNLRHFCITQDPFHDDCPFDYSSSTASVPVDSLQRRECFSFGEQEGSRLSQRLRESPVKSSVAGATPRISRAVVKDVAPRHEVVPVSDWSGAHHPDHTGRRSVAAPFSAARRFTGG